MANSFQNSPVISDILSRLTSVESVQGALPTPTEYDTVSELRAETIYSNTDRALVSAPINGNVYIYVFNESVSEPDNGETVLTPDDITEPAGGRWVADVSLSIVGHTHANKADKIDTPDQDKFLVADSEGNPVEHTTGPDDYSVTDHEHSEYLDETDKEELEQAVEDAVNTVANKMNKLTGITAGQIGSIPFIREDGHLDPSTIKATNIPSSDEKAGIVGLTGADPAAKFSQIQAILALLSSDDTTLDELQEIVDFIKLNRDDLDTLSVSSIIGLQNLLDLKLGDAPEDDYSYVRNNGEWVKEVSVVQVESTSRTIYVETTGDDETGDGTSVETAFATLDRAAQDIKKNVLNCTITIQFGVGSFNISSSTAPAFIGINLIGTGSIEIKGTLVDALTGITCSATSDPFVYGVSGQSFSLDAYVGYFAYRNDGIVIPIASHDANQIHIPYFAGTKITKIVSLGTVFNVSCSADGNELTLAINALKGDTVSSSNLNVVYTYIDFQLTGSLFVSAKYSIKFQSCRFIQLLARYVISPSNGHYSSCYFYGTRHILYYVQYALGWVEIGNCVVKGGSSYNGMFLYGTAIRKMNSILFDGLSYAFEFYDDYSQIMIDKDIKLNNMSGLCSLYHGELVQSPGTTIYINNVDHLLYLKSSTSVKILLHSISGPLTSGNISASSTWNGLYFDPDNQLFISVPNIYSNFSLEKSGVLYAETKVLITIGDITQNRSIIIDYTIERNTLFEEGQLRILYNGSTLQFLQPSNLKQDNNSGSGIGATFNVDFDATDTDLINLGITLDSGDDATFKYDVKRSML